MKDLTLDLSSIVNTAINQKIGELGLEEKIQEMLNEVAKNSTKTLVVKLDGGGGDGKRFPLVHKQFEDLLNLTAIKGMNPLLTGGAGLAKTTTAMQVAEALELDFCSTSFCNQTTKTDLYGFVDANGNYKMSAFVDAFENGKLFLADEFDACSSNVAVLLNSAIDNGFLTLADGKVIYAHDSFRIIATANTNLRGAKDGFTARNKMDGATTDRFTIIEWLLDEDLEDKIANNKGWVKIVRNCRDTAENELDGVVITPRASYKGATLLKAGFNIDKVLQMVVVKAMGEDESKMLLSGITKNMKATAIKDAGMKKPEPKPEPKEEQEYEDKMEDMEEIEVEDVKTFKQGFEEEEEEEDKEFGW